MTLKENELISAKLNFSQIMQGLIIGLLSWQLYKTQELSEIVATSDAERSALKEQITELKTEVKDLRNLVYRAMVQENSVEPSK